MPVALAAAGTDGWKFDVLRLTNGKTFQGLLVEETPSEVRFQCVRRSPGTATVVIFTTFRRDEVRAIDRLEPRERAALAARLKALDPTGKGENVRMEGLELKAVPWVRPGEGEALAYRSVHFVLVSNARDDIVRRAAVRLEQIYAAYARFLPLRRPSAKPTTIVLVRSLTEYQDLLKGEGRNLLNPAFYDPAQNRVVCACNLQRLGDDLARVRKERQQQLDEVKEREAALVKQFRGKVPPDLLAGIQEDRKKIAAANARSEAFFRDATRQLFRTLYHESFHAYLANFVYPPDEDEVPRWLNEGLAQIFETALVEAGELRVGHADAERLTRAKAAIRKDELVPLAELLRSGPKQFLVAHATDQQVSDRHYLTSWALAFYLSFDRKVLGTLALDRYVRALKRGTDPAEAFQELTGTPTAQLEKDFYHYVLSLRPDGTVAKE